MTRNAPDSHAGERCWHAAGFARRWYAVALLLASVVAAHAGPGPQLVPAATGTPADAGVLVYRSVSPLPYGAQPGGAKLVSVGFADAALPPMQLDVETLGLQAGQPAAGNRSRQEAPPAPQQAGLPAERVRSLWTHRRTLTAWLIFDGLTDGIRKQLEARAPLPKTARIQGLGSDTYAEIRDLPDGTGGVVLKKLDGKVITPEAPIPVAVEPLFHGVFIACIRAEPPSVSPLPMQAFGRRHDPARRCGLMGMEGRWLARPEFGFMEMVSGDDAYGPYLLLLRGNEPCVSTLHQPVVTGCLGEPLTALFSANRLPFAAATPDSTWRGGQTLGYLAPDGGWAIPPAFNVAGPFRGSIATVEQRGLAGIIDSGGKWLTPQLPADPVAARWLLQRGNGRGPIEGNGLIDYQGRMLVPLMYPQVGQIDDRGRVEVCHQNGCDVIPAGKPSAHPQVATVSAPPEDAKAREAAKWVPTAENGVWGYRDADDHWVMKPRFAEAEPFASGLAAVRQDEHWGVVTTGGKWLFKPEFASIQPFSGGVAVAEDSNGRHTLLHASGERIALDGRVESAFAGDGLAIARDASNNKVGFIDGRGNWIVKPQYADAQPFRDGYAVVSGNLPADWRPPGLVEPAFVAISVHWLSPKLVAVRAFAGGEERFGLMDRNGRWLVPAVDK